MGYINNPENNLLVKFINSGADKEMLEMVYNQEPELWKRAKEIEPFILHKVAKHAPLHVFETLCDWSDETDQKVQDNEGFAPIHVLASIWQSPKIREKKINFLLTKHPELVDLRDASGSTPVILAARNQNTVLSEILKFNPDLSIQDNKLNNVLHEIYMNIYPDDIVTIINRFPQGLSVKNVEGHTPLARSILLSQDDGNGEVRLITLATIKHCPQVVEEAFKLEWSLPENPEEYETSKSSLSRPDKHGFTVQDICRLSGLGYCADILDAEPQPDYQPIVPKYKFKTNDFALKEVELKYLACLADVATDEERLKSFLDEYGYIIERLSPNVASLLHADPGLRAVLFLDDQLALHLLLKLPGLRQSFLKNETVLKLLAEKTPTVVISLCRNTPDFANEVLNKNSILLSVNNLHSLLIMLAYADHQTFLLQLQNPKLLGHISKLLADKMEDIGFDDNETFDLDRLIEQELLNEFPHETYLLLCRLGDMSQLGRLQELEPAMPSLIISAAYSLHQDLMTADDTLVAKKYKNFNTIKQLLDLLSVILNCAAEHPELKDNDEVAAIIDNAQVLYARTMPSALAHPQKLLKWGFKHNPFHVYLLKGFTKDELLRFSHGLSTSDTEKNNFAFAEQRDSFGFTPKFYAAMLGNHAFNFDDKNRSDVPMFAYDGIEGQCSTIEELYSLFYEAFNTSAPDTKKSFLIEYPAIQTIIADIESEKTKAAQTEKLLQPHKAILRTSKEKSTVEPMIIESSAKQSTSDFQSNIKHRI